MFNKQMEIHFTTQLPFDHNSPVSPDNYYLGECIELLNTLFGEQLKEVDEAGGGGQGCGYYWVAFYLDKEENNIELLVTHNGLDIYIELQCDTFSHKINQFWNLLTAKYAMRCDMK